MAKFRVIPHEVDASYDAEGGTWIVTEHDGTRKDYSASEFRGRFMPESTASRDLWLCVYNDAGWGFDSLVNKTGYSGEWQDTVDPNIQVRANLNPPGLRYKDTGVELTEAECQAYHEVLWQRDAGKLVTGPLGELVPRSELDADFDAGHDY